MPCVQLVPVLHTLERMSLSPKLEYLLMFYMYKNAKVCMCLGVWCVGNSLTLDDYLGCKVWVLLVILHVMLQSSAPPPPPPPPHMTLNPPSVGNIKCYAKGLLPQAEFCHYDAASRAFCPPHAELIVQGINISAGNGTGFCSCGFKEGLLVCLRSKLTAGGGRGGGCVQGVLQSRKIASKQQKTVN